MYSALNSFIGIPLVSVLLGALITWVVAWLYYKKAGEELKQEAEKLRQLSDLIIYILAHPDAKVTPKYDDKGNISGLAVDMSATVFGSGELSAKVDGGSKN